MVLPATPDKASNGKSNMSAEKKEPITKKRMSRRQLFKMVGNVGKGQPVDTQLDKPALVGTVKYPWGTVAGATVSIGGKSIASDKTGKYEITGLGPGSYTLVAKAPFSGYKASPQKIQVKTGETEVADIYLDFNKTVVEGHVRDLSGDPIAGATISGVFCQNDLVSTTTDKEGYFKFDTARPGNQFIRVNAAGYVAETRDFLAKEEETAIVDFHLAFATSKIHGTITDPDKQPLQAEVVLRKSDVIIQKTMSDPRTGNYEFFVVPGTYGLLATSPEYQTEGWRGEVVKDTKVDLGFSLPPWVVSKVKMSPENTSEPTQG